MSRYSAREKKNPFEQLRVDMPKPNDITIGEMETYMIAADTEQDKRLYHYIGHGGAIYPNVHVPTNLGQEENGDQPPSAHFQNKDQILASKRTENRTMAQQFYEMHVPNLIRNYIQVMKSSSKFLLETTEKCAFYFPLLQKFFSARVPNSHLDKYLQDNIDKLPARTFDWHFTLFRFAVTLQDQSVYFYDLLKEGWSAQVLRHEFHKNVRVCKHKPSTTSESILAVGTENGICLWDTTQRLTPLFESRDEDQEYEDENIFIRPKRQYKDETQNGVCVFLKTSSPVTTIEWFPPSIASTRKVIAHEQIVEDIIYPNMFVSGSISDHRVMIWQLVPPVQTSRTSIQNWNYNWRCVQVLDRKNGGIKAMAFSPNGKYLAVFTIIWETKTWTTEKWSCFDKPVQSFSWSANSRYLVVSHTGDSSLHIIRFDQEPPRINGEYVTDIPLHTIVRAEDEYENIPSSTLCGPIREFAIDHEGGERLVVSFEESNMLAVLQCDFENMGTKTMYLPVGFIKGPKNSGFARHLKFWPNFRKGALLSVVWDSGKIGFYPLYYIDESISWNRGLASSVTTRQTE